MTDDIYAENVVQFQEISLLSQQKGLVIGISKRRFLKKLLFIRVGMDIF